MPPSQLERLRAKLAARRAAEQRAQAAELQGVQDFEQQQRAECAAAESAARVELAALQAACRNEAKRQRECRRKNRQKERKGQRGQPAGVQTTPRSAEAAGPASEGAPADPAYSGGAGARQPAAPGVGSLGRAGRLGAPATGPQQQQQQQAAADWHAQIAGARELLAQLGGTAQLLPAIDPAALPTSRPTGPVTAQGGWEDPDDLLSAPAPRRALGTPPPAAECALFPGVQCAPGTEDLLPAVNRLLAAEPARDVFSCLAVQDVLRRLAAMYDGHEPPAQGADAAATAGAPAAAGTPEPEWVPLRRAPADFVDPTAAPELLLGDGLMPLTVVGDLHGQLADLLGGVLGPVLRREEPPSRFLFLGDLVDRGAHGLEVFLTVALLNICFPEHIVLIRGNHECARLTQEHGFQQEVAEKYPDMVTVDGRELPALWLLFSRVAPRVPVAAVVRHAGTGARVFCCHGGLSPALAQQGADPLRFVRSLKRRTYGASVLLSVLEPAAAALPVSPTSQAAIDGLLWSDPYDPSDSEHAREPPPPGCRYMLNHVRSCGYIWTEQASEEFCRAHGIDFICRAHQVVKDGYLWLHHGRVLTVFSASDYCNYAGNLGAAMMLSAGHPPSFRTWFRPSLSAGPPAHLSLPPRYFGAPEHADLPAAAVAAGPAQEAVGAAAAAGAAALQSGQESFDDVVHLAEPGRCSAEEAARALVAAGGEHWSPPVDGGWGGAVDGGLAGGTPGAPITATPAPGLRAVPVPAPPQAPDGDTNWSDDQILQLLAAVNAVTPEETCAAVQGQQQSAPEPGPLRQGLPAQLAEHPAEQLQHPAEQRCERLRCMLRFLREVSTGELVLGRKRHQLLKDIKERGYTRFPTARSAESAGAGGAESAGEHPAGSDEELGYEYLLSMPIGDFCAERAAELEEQLRRAQQPHHFSPQGAAAWANPSIDQGGAAAAQSPPLAVQRAAAAQGASWGTAQGAHGAAAAAGSAEQAGACPAAAGKPDEGLATRAALLGTTRRRIMKEHKTGEDD